MRDTVAEIARALGRHGVGDAFGRRTRGVTVEYRSNVLERVRYSASSGVGARVVEGGRLGAAGGTDPEDPARLVEDAREAARFGPEVPDLALGDADSSEDARATAHTSDLPTEALRALADAVVAHVRAAHPEVLVDVTVARAHTEEHLANTHGLLHRATRARVRLSATVKRNRDGDLLTLSAGGSAPRIDDPRVDPARIARELLERLERCGTRATLTTGEWPVVFTGAAVAGLLYPLLQGLSGENLARGTSPLCTRAPRLAPWLTLASDPTLRDPPAAGATPRDGDGLPARRVDLVRDGGFVGGCFDAVTAARLLQSGRALPFGPDFGRPGCATRPGTGGTTAPGPSVLSLTSSIAPLRDPLEGIRTGLLVESLLGVRMGNPLSGEFSNSVHVGYRIEDGRVVGRVKDLMVAGNVYSLLADLEGLGARPEWDDDEALLPPVRARSVRVTSKA
jgi:PmbA protein